MHRPSQFRRRLNGSVFEQRQYGLGLVRRLRRQDPGLHQLVLSNIAQGVAQRDPPALLASAIPPVAMAVMPNSHQRSSGRSATLRVSATFLIYRRTKKLRAVQLLLGHTKLESTVRYLGIEVDDALEMAERTEV